LRSVSEGPSRDRDQAAEHCGEFAGGSAALLPRDVAVRERARHPVVEHHLPARSVSSLMPIVPVNILPQKGVQWQRWKSHAEPAARMLSGTPRAALPIVMRALFHT